MGSKSNGYLWTIVGFILCIIGIYINFEYPFMHYIVFGLMFIGLAFVVFVTLWYIIDNIKLRRQKKKANSIINFNPNGYLIWRRKNRGFHINNSQIINEEELIIKYEQNYPLYKKWQEWGDIQSDYSKNCRNLMNDNAGYGYYYYNFAISQLDEIGKKEKGVHPIWQFFIYAYSSYINSDEFTKENFGYIINNNSNVEKIKGNTFNLFPDGNDKVIKLLNLILGKYPNLLVLCLIPDGVTNKEDFYNRYYNPIAEANSSISFYRIDDPCRLSNDQFKNKYVVLLDIYTEDDKQIVVAEQIASNCKIDSPYIVYLSLFKEYSKQELEELIVSKKQEIEREKEKKEEIKCLLDDAISDARGTFIEFAQKKIAEAEKKNDNEISFPIVREELKQLIDTTKVQLNQEYTSIGFSEKREDLYVDYSTPSEFVELKEWMYVVAKFPKKGAIVYPYERRKVARVGHIEKSFYNQLLSWLPEQIVVINDICVNYFDNQPAYEPDITLLVEGHPTIRIDVEIDEPYAAITREPIHFLSCGDDYRDDLFNRLGWIVVRFAERQIKEYPKSCANYLARLVKAIVPEIEIPDSIANVDPLPLVKKWTKNEAIKMAVNNERENYLQHTFRKTEEIQIELGNNKLNEYERRCKEKVDKPKIDQEFVEKMRCFTDADRYEQDKHIDFIAHEHIYLNTNNEEHFLPVSSLIAYFFEEFDAKKQAEMQWERYGIPIQESLDKWERIGKRASEVGTFMHLQTEEYFNKGVFETTYQFNFNDNIEEISIEKEKQHFLHFVKDYNINETKYRQEWPIYDEDLNVAGTIDLTCQVDTNTFIIYDWKRSSKVVNCQGQPIVESYGGKMGFNGVNLPDTSFYHYCIQQNLYRYILQKNYGIKVNELNLVVLWPEYPTYYVAKVPIMDNIIEQIIDVCHQQDLGHRLLS